MFGELIDRSMTSEILQTGTNEYGIKTFEYSFRYDGREYTFNIQIPHQEFYLIPMQTIGETGNERIFGPYLLTNDSIYLPQYFNYADNGLATVLSGFKRQSLFKDVSMDETGFVTRQLDSSLFGKIASDLHVSDISLASASEYYYWFNNHDQIPVSSNSIYNPVDFNSIYNNLWYIDYFNQMKYHFNEYSEIDWLNVFYQFDPSTYIHEINTLLGTHYVYNEPERIHFKANIFSFTGDIYTTLKYYNSMKLQEYVRETLHDVVIPVIHYDGKMGIFSGASMKDPDKIDIVAMWADEYMAYIKLKSFEMLDEDDNYASTVRDLILMEKINKFDNAVRDRALRQIDLREIDQEVSLTLQNKYTLSPMSIRNPSQWLSTQGSLIFTTNKIAYPGMGILSSYYKSSIELYGRGISGISIAFDIINQLKDNYADINDFHRYLQRMGNEMINLTYHDLSSAYTKLVANLFKEHGRSVGGYFDDLFQKMRHKIFESKIKLWTPVLVYNTPFRDVIYDYSTISIKIKQSRDLWSSIL